MRRRIIFLDIDGTLVNTSANPEFIPESAIKAVQQARQNGHQIYLCTGRSKAEIPGRAFRISVHRQEL